MPLQRIVMISLAPNELQLFDPVTRTAQKVALDAAPVSLSISPNGLFAAVGHFGSASYVDLTNRSVVRTYAYSSIGSGSESPVDVVLASDWLYVFPGQSVYSMPLSIRLSTGAATSSPGSDRSNAARLHPGGKAIYAASYNSYPIQRYSITTEGLLGNIVSLPSQTESLCGGNWFSPDGLRIYNGCGVVLRYNADPALDMRLLGRFVTGQVQAVSESAGRIAAIPSSPGAENQVILIASDGFQEQGRIAIPSFLVGGRNFVGQGRWLFLNASGSALHVVYQADSASGLLNDFAVQTYDLTARSTCNAAFLTPTLAIGNEGGIKTLGIQGDADCFYNAVSAVDWVQIISGGSGTGLGSVTLHVRSNTGTARTGSVTLGSQTLQIAQTGSAGVPAQQVVSYKIRDAEYSKSLDRIVLVAEAPNELHLYDPLTRVDQFVSLAYPALSLSVSPDGWRAAVGHNGYISIVNLQARIVEKLIPTASFAANEVILTGDWLYAFSSSSGQAIEVATNSSRIISTSPQVARLHPSRDWAYVVSGYSGVSRLDVRSGGTTVGTSIPNLSACGNLWVSEDGRRFYTACGTVHRSSNSPVEDGVANGRFPVPQSYDPAVSWVVHSSARQQVALLSARGYGSPSAEVQLYGDDGLPILGRLRLSDRIDGGVNFPVRGRWLFWNQAANRLYAITQADSTLVPSQTTAPLSDFSIQVVQADSLAACSVTVSPQIVNLPGAGSPAVDVAVQTGPLCVWSAAGDSPSYWVRFSSYDSSSSSSGIGPGVLRVSADRNPGIIPRTGTFTVGGVSVTVNQAVPTPFSVYSSQTSFPVSGSYYNTVSVSVATGSLPWTAVSNASWITITNGPNFVGSTTVQFSVAANPGAARSGTMTIAGETIRIDQAGVPLAGNMRFVPVTPCRVVDTRALTGETGALGLPVMESSTQRDFPIPQGRCNIPTNAAAYSLNATVIPRGTLSYLTLWPTGSPRPLASTLNSMDGRVKANAAIVPAGANGAISAFVTDRTDLILDINGYFVPTASRLGFPFYSLTPCRVVDTRVGGTPLAAGQSRNFSINSCDGTVLSNATAYSLNVTVIPRSASLSYLTIWPAGLPQPVVSTLNAPTGTVVANAALVPSGLGGSISVYATDAADVVIDINGYFGSGTGTPLSFYPLTPCRVVDTRTNAGLFGGPVIAAEGARSYTVPNSACGVSFNARAYSMNATVVPSGTLSYLTLWPTGSPQPGVSTLNSFDGSVVANALLVPAGTNGAINAFVTDQTHLILDINGYFAQ